MSTLNDQLHDSTGNPDLRQIYSSDLLQKPDVIVHQRQAHFYPVYGDTPRHTPILEHVAHSRGSAEVLEWQEVSGRARLSAYQRDSLLRVAELHHRKF
ncbi:unnamed protein product [Arctogadus glacialis]